MSASAWAAAAVLAISSISYMLLVLTGSAFPGLPSSPRLSAGNGNGGAAAGRIGRYRLATAVVSFVASLASLVAATIALVKLFDPVLGGSGGTLSVQQLAASAGVAAIGAITIRTASLKLAPEVRDWFRRKLAPMNTVIGIAAATPGLETFLSPSEENDDDGGQGNAVAAVLEENLHLLEASGISVDQRELHMIRGILRMDRVRVREIMRPRVDMVTAPADADPGQLKELMTVGGYSKIPIHGETIDDIVGVVFARDLLHAENNGDGKPVTLKDLARPAMFIPESQNMEQLLREFQQHRTSIGIVVDEYGGVSGLITVTDLVEEIVGDLEDEFDIHEPDLQPINRTETLVDARLSLEAFNRALGTSLQAEGFDTVGGLVYRELGKMPSVGDRTEVDGLRITVHSTAGRRIRKLRVARQGPLVEEEVG
jgi:Mg2+/Co2+ transporter CorC